MAKKARRAPPFAPAGALVEIDHQPTGINPKDTLTQPSNQTEGRTFLTPREAVSEMLAAGASFTVRDRDDGLGLAFTYTIADRGDLERCRATLKAVKAKPFQFVEAFKVEIQRMGAAR